MEEPQGQLFSSKIPDITVNFRTSENNENILNTLRDFQILKDDKNNNLDEIEHDIFNEEGAMFILLKSNLRERPTKLLIDTGASISLLAKDVIPNETHIMNYIVNLYGIVGKDASIKTLGMVHGSFLIGNNLLETTLHLVDTKYAGPADGYLDFLSSYKVIIDMNEMKMKFKLKKSTKEGAVDARENSNNIIEDVNDNFLNEGYNFDDEFEEISTGKKNVTNLTQNENNINLPNKIGELEPISSFGEYFEAMNFYKREFEKEKLIKVNSSHEDTDVKLIYERIFPQGIDIEEHHKRAQIIYTKLNLKNCNADEKDLIKGLCLEFYDQFYIDGDMLQSTDVIKHYIKLIPNTGIVSVRQYRIPQAHRAVLKEIVED